MSEYTRLRIDNARIESTFLGIDDHGLLAQLCLDYGSGGQCFQAWLKSMNMDFFEDLFDVIGVDKWESLKGKLVRAEHSWEHIEKIGNIIDDKWISPKDYVISQSISQSS